MPKSALKPVLKENYCIRSFDIDVNRKLRISNLCGFLQETAEKHAEHLGVGFHKILESGLVWMLSRLFIEIHEYPLWKDIISVETWPSGKERLFYRRDFQVYQDHLPVISAVSYWLAIHIKTLRPQIIPFDETVLKHNAGRFAIQGAMEKINAPEGGNVRSHEIRYSELDQNKHVNNTKYVDWIMDSFQVSQLEQSLPHFFGIEYKHEVKEHDIVRIHHAPDPLNDNVILVEGTLGGDDKVCFRSKVGF